MGGCLLLNLDLMLAVKCETNILTAFSGCTFAAARHKSDAKRPATRVSMILVLTNLNSLRKAS